MNIRRIQHKGNTTFQIEAQQSWFDIKHIPEIAHITDILDLLSISLETHEIVKEKVNNLPNSNANNNPDKVLLPLQPKSYRDFALYEGHLKNAKKMLIKRQFPRLYKFLCFIDKLPLKKSFFELPKIWYKQPLFYYGNHLNFQTDQAKIILPEGVKFFDYEAEIGFVLVKDIQKYSSLDECREAIGGFVIFNDFSARDKQIVEMMSGFGPQGSKHYANTISSIVSSYHDILPKLNNLKGYIEINSEKVCELSSKGMSFKIEECLQFLSHTCALYSGEFFATGTLNGGSGVETNKSGLKVGDKVSIRLEELGTLENFIV